MCNLLHVDGADDVVGWTLNEHVHLTASSNTTTTHATRKRASKPDNFLQIRLKLPYRSTHKALQSASYTIEVVKKVHDEASIWATALSLAAVRF